MAVDYVCNTHVDESKVGFQVTYRDKTYYFCSNECKTTFLKNPEKIIEERRNPWNRAGQQSCCH